jgi:hypothetical protein
MHELNPTRHLQGSFSLSPLESRCVATLPHHYLDLLHAYVFLLILTLDK